MSDTIIVSIIGGLTTIIVPIITWILTSKSKEKEKKNALNSMQKDHEHELEKIKIQHDHDIKTKQHELEFEIAKSKAEVENTKDLDKDAAINKLVTSYFNDEMKKPDSEISKQFKEASKQNSRNFIRNKG